MEGPFNLRWSILNVCTLLIFCIHQWDCPLWTVMAIVDGPWTDFKKIISLQNIYAGSLIAWHAYVRVHHICVKPWCSRNIGNNIPVCHIVVMFVRFSDFKTMMYMYVHVVQSNADYQCITRARLFSYKPWFGLVYMYVFEIQKHVCCNRTMSNSFYTGNQHAVRVKTYMYLFIELAFS